jgi:trimeric autotransporter adhesin
VSVIPQSTAKDITDFRFVGVSITPIVGTIDQTAKTITISLPYGKNLTALVATFTNSPLSTVKIGSVVQVSGTTVNNFTTPLLYDVYAEDGSKKTYTVTASIYEMPKEFLTFKFDTYTLVNGDTLRYVANGTINNVARLIQVNIPGSAQKTSLAAIFTLTANTRALIGSVTQVSGTTLNDFSSARTYTLAADDGSTVDYTVTVTNNPIDTQKQLLTFAFNGLNPAVQGVITESTKTISVTVPYGTDRSAMVATFTTTSSLTRVKVSNFLQKSGVSVNDFTGDVAYRCYDEAGNYTEYTVTVTVAPGSPLKDITYFAFLEPTPDVIGAINETNRTITAIVPNGVSRNGLKATFTLSPYATARVQGTVQESGITPNDFRIPIVYEVTAQDGTTKNYTVSIGESPDTTKPVVSNALQTVDNRPGQFVLVRSNESAGKVYIIKENALQSTVAQLEAAVTAGLGRSGFVVAANADVALSTANLPDGKYYAYAIDAALNKSAKGTNAITVLDRIPPVATVAAQTKNNALNSVVYVQSSESNSIVYLIKEGELTQSKVQLDAAVTAKKGAKALVLTANSDVPVIIAGVAAGNYHAYAVDIPAGNVSAPSTNVVVITEASKLKSILAFSFNQLSPPVIGQIIGTDISLTVKVGTPITALVATFTLSPLSKAYVGAIQQVSGTTPNDFTSPVTYRVTAEDGSFTDYTVSVWFNTGIDQSELLRTIKSFPNPVSDRLTIESTQPLDRIQVINSLGQTMEDIRNPGTSVIEIQTGSWLKGMYFVRYYNDEKFIGVHKLIKD